MRCTSVKQHKVVVAGGGYGQRSALSGDSRRTLHQEKKVTAATVPARRNRSEMIDDKPGALVAQRQWSGDDFRRWPVKIKRTIYFYAQPAATAADLCDSAEKPRRAELSAEFSSATSTCNPADEKTAYVRTGSKWPFQWGWAR